MATRIVFLPEARADIREAATWYRAASRPLARRFRAEVRASLSSIRKNPLQFQEIYPPVRRAVVNVFPYEILYTATDEYVLVIACLHGSRDPNVWKRRG